MEYKHSSGLTILEGLDPIRRRPAMYIDGEDVHPSRLLEYVVTEIAQERPQEIRILLWREDAATIVYDGTPLPIEPVSLRGDGVSHPALYRSFMYLLAGTSAFHAVLNALSERLVVSTMHAGHRYRVVFSKGMIERLLGRADCDRPLGVTGLTFGPDATIIAGNLLTSHEVLRLAERVQRETEGVRIHVEDRMTEDADWYYNQRACGRNKTPALPLDQQRNSCPYRSRRREMSLMLAIPYPKVFQNGI
jgi:DNA gyrase subunit B